MKNAATNPTAIIPTKRASKKSDTNRTKTHQQTQQLREVTLTALPSQISATPRKPSLPLSALQDCPAIQRTSPACRNSAMTLMPRAATAASTRPMQRPPRRFRHPPHQPAALLAIRLPLGTPAARLTELRKRTVTQYAQQSFRHGAPGGTRFTVEFADSTTEVDYTIDLGRNYDGYRGAYKGWGANVDIHRIRVPADWRIRVERKGLTLLGGLMTLDALPMEAPAGIELYAAVWASQGRGYAVKTDRGFIAVAGGDSFHSDTAEGAISGLRRKGRSGPSRAAAIADMKSSVNVFITKYTRCAIDVSVADARQSGSCTYVIRSWCASVRVDIARVQVPMAELLEGFRRLPQTEVRRAVLSPVRRNRSVYSG